MHDIVPIGRMIVLLLVLLPLASAALAPLFGRASRRFALLMVLLHLLLTIASVAFTIQVLAARPSSDMDPNRSDVIRFKPEFVPGDPSGRHGAWNRTTWTLLSLTGDQATGDRAGPHIQFFIGLDGLNMWLVALASFMMLPALLVSWDSIKDRQGAYYGCLFLLQGGAIGAFLSFDVILFYAFFELTLIPAYLLIGRWGIGSGRRDAARKFFLYTLAGSLLTLIGIIGIVVTNPTPINPRTGTPVTSAVVDVFIPDASAPSGVRGEKALAGRGPITFSLPDLMSNVQIWADAGNKAKSESAKLEETHTNLADRPGVTRQVLLATENLLASAKRVESEAADYWRRAQRIQCWMFVALMAGFMVKVPIWPFHTWLPPAYGESPTGATILLSALLAKLGTFGILRLVLPLTPDAAIMYGLPVVGSLAAFGIVYAALCAYGQKDMKLVIAYSSVSHLGFLILGIFAFNAEGLSGAVLHMVNHGITTGALFALLGFLLDRYGTTQIAHYGGLMGRFPNFAVLTFVLCLASIGLPGLNNFVSEMLMLAGVYNANNPRASGLGLTVVAAFSIFLSAWYILTMLQRVFFNPPKEPLPVVTDRIPTDLTRREFITYGSLAGLCLLLGLFPQTVLDTMKGDVHQLAQIGKLARARVTGVPLIEPVADVPSTGPPAGVQPGKGGQFKGGAPKGGGGAPKGGGKGKNKFGEDD